MASFLATVIILTVTWKAEVKIISHDRHKRDTQAYVLKSLRYAFEVLMSQGKLYKLFEKKIMMIIQMRSINTTCNQVDFYCRVDCLCV